MKRPGWKILAALAGLAFLIYALEVTQVELGVLLAGWPKAQEILRAFVRPDLEPEFLLYTLEKVWETIVIALLSTFLSVAIAYPLAFLAARNVMGDRLLGRTVYALMRTVFNVLRVIDALVLAVIFAVWVGLGPFAGVLALTTHSVGVLGKLFSEAMEEVDPEIIEAIRATGAHPVQVVLAGVVPQALPLVWAYAFYRMDTNLRMSTVLGFVGAGGIGYVLIEKLNTLRYAQASTVLWEIGILVSLFDFLSGWLRGRLAARQ